MLRSEGRILTTHVGSLIRPDDLLAQATVAPGEQDTQKYRQSLRAAVADVVRRQVETGIDIVNDGEFGKSSWAAYILERLSGFEVRPEQRQPIRWLGRDVERFREFFEKEMPQSITGSAAEVCVGPIKYTDTDSIRRDLTNLRAAVDAAGPAEAFFTTVAPASTACIGSNECYAGDRENVYAIAEALREEYQAIHQAGFLVQVDDAVLANMYDYLVSQNPDEYYRWAGLRTDALNHARLGIPM